MHVQEFTDLAQWFEDNVLNFPEHGGGTYLQAEYGTVEGPWPSAKEESNTEKAEGPWPSNRVETEEEAEQNLIEFITGIDGMS